MLLKKWEQALPHVCILTAELKCHAHSLPFGEKCWEQFHLASVCVPDSVFTQMSWGRWLFAVLRPLREAAAAAGSGSGLPCLLGWNLLCLSSVPRSQKQWELLCVMDSQDSTCCPSVSFSFPKSCYTLSIMKTVFQSEFLSMKTCKVLGNAFPQLWSQFMCIPACLLDNPRYPTYQQVVILGDSRFC